MLLTEYTSALGVKFTFKKEQSADDLQIPWVNVY